MYHKMTKMKDRTLKIISKKYYISRNYYNILIRGKLKQTGKKQEHKQRNRMDKNSK